MQGDTGVGKNLSTASSCRDLQNNFFFIHPVCDSNFTQHISKKSKTLHGRPSTGRENKLKSFSFAAWIFNSDRPRAAAVADDPTVSDVRDKTRATSGRRNVNLVGHFEAHYSMKPDPHLPPSAHQPPADGSIAA